jgi:uncharacterized membrane protein
VGLFTFVLMPDDWRLISRVLIGWDIGVAVYLALGIWTAIVTDAKHIRLRSVLFDEGRVLIPLLCVTAALASLGAIFFQLSTAPAGRRFVNLAFAAVTILLSWSFIQFSFAFHYASAPQFWNVAVRVRAGTIPVRKSPLWVISGHTDKHPNGGLRLGAYGKQRQGQEYSVHSRPPISADTLPTATTAMMSEGMAMPQAD